MTIAIDNERTKLMANALDRASTGCLVVGIFAPLATGFLGSGIGPFAMASSAEWLVAAIMLDFGARRVLGGLKQ